MKGQNDITSNVMMGTEEILERMRLSWIEKIFISYFPRARENASKVISKYDFYRKLLKKLYFEIEESDKKMYVLNHFFEEVPANFEVEVLSEQLAYYSMEQYKRRIVSMEKRIPSYKALLDQSEELYGKKNLYRLLYSMITLFQEGNCYVGLIDMKSKHEWNLELVKNEIKNAPFQPFYMLAGNRIDFEELSAFNIMGDRLLSGIVISRQCTIERMLQLVDCYYKNCDICQIAVLPFN